MMPMAAATLSVWVISRSSAGRIGKIRPMPTASSAMVAKMTISGRLVADLEGGEMIMVRGAPCCCRNERGLKSA